jgi:hypothetical protein
VSGSDTYQDHGVIVLWWDESEGGGMTPAGLCPSSSLPRMRKNVNGALYSNTIKYSHSSFLRSLQENLRGGSSASLPLFWAAPQPRPISPTRSIKA